MFAAAVPLAIGQVIAGLFAQRQQGKENMRLAEFQAAANERYLAQQLEYNSPKNQMLRFQEAGLNPHLVYGQGNPGNQSAPLQHPEVKPRDFRELMSMVPLMNTASLTSAQVQATNQKTLKDGVLTELARAQKALIDRNPIFKDSYLNDVVDLMRSTALIKSNELDTSSHLTQFLTNAQNEQGRSIAQQKVLAELKLLEQKFNLGTQDAVIKKNIIESQEFKNAMLEVQKKFLADGDIGPQQILTFVLMLLGKI